MYDMTDEIIEISWWSEKYSMFYHKKYIYPELFTEQKNHY